MSLAIIKTSKRDPPPWMILMAVAMLLITAAFMTLPAFLKSYESGEYGLTIIANSSTDQIHDQSFNQTVNTMEDGQMDEVGESPSQDRLSVLTSNGWIQGVQSDGVRVFHGVPYAKPPIGHLRWAAPREMDAWSPLVYNATYKRNGCPQLCVWRHYCPKSTSEDCLYLEIYTPLDASPRSRLPVMVYLHGGSFHEMSATSTIYDPSYVVRRNHVMVVLVEYRLGALGFLVYSEDASEMAGNFGLLDQALALEWIQRHVQAFGGDPDKVTLAGQSAGSQSALIHLQSPETARKFRSVILESHPLSFVFKNFSEGVEQTRRFVDLTGCSNATPETTIDLDCLRNLDTDTILDAQHQIKTFGTGYLNKAQPWGPVLDKKILFNQPLDSFEDEQWYRKPILWGVTEEEALLFVKYWFPHPTGSFVYSLAASILGKGMDGHRLKSLYPATSNDSRDDVAQMATDFLFRCPLQWVTEKLHNKGIDTMWTYVWHKTLIFSKSDSKYICSDRSCHGVEIPYVFHNFDSLNSTSEDLRMSDNVIDYYANFIKYGNPNKREKNRRGSLPDWPKAFLSGKYQTLGFRKDGTLAIESGVHENQCQLWIDKKFKLK